MADIFISYSSKDRAVVSQIATLLESRGWSIWWDTQISIGKRFDSTIEVELQKAKCVIVVWTKNSIESEWVKNEANNAAERGVLVPVLLEPVTIPLAFSRIETAMLADWNGEEDNHELTILFNSIEAIVNQEKEIATNGKTNSAGSDSEVEQLRQFSLKKQSLQNKKPAAKVFYILIAVVSIAVIALLFNYLLAGKSEKNITVRVFDWKKNAVTQGDVKVYLHEYVRTQSIDKSGQALFTGLPADMFNNRMKIEVSSPGYTSRTFDTLLKNTTTLELVLPLSTVVYIRGKVKTAAEVPIKGVEINVDGTRYYALSITDGSYSLRLEEYTLGDEITLTTSHKDFEDKTIVLRINSPDITNQDIFLNPVTR